MAFYRRLINRGDTTGVSTSSREQPKSYVAYLASKPLIRTCQTSYGTFRKSRRLACVCRQTAGHAVPRGKVVEMLQDMKSEGEKEKKRIGPNGLTVTAFDGTGEDRIGRVRRTVRTWISQM